MRKFLILIICGIFMGWPNSGICQGDQLLMRQGESIIHSLYFTPTSNRLITASLDGTIVMWDIRTAKRRWTLDLDADRSKEKHTVSHLYHMVLSPDGKTVAVSYDQTTVINHTVQSDKIEQITLINADTGKPTKVISANTGNLAFSPDNNSLVTIGVDSTARFWDTKSGKETMRIKLGFQSGTPLFSPTGRAMIVANRLEWDSSEPMISVYDVETGRKLKDLPKQYVQIVGLDISHDGKYLAVGGFNGGVFSLNVWNLTEEPSPDPTDLLTKDEKLANNVVFSTDDRLLASSGFSRGRQIVAIRTISTNKIFTEFLIPSDVRSLAFSPYQRRLAIGTSNGEILVKSF